MFIVSEHITQPILFQFIINNLNFIIMKTIKFEILSELLKQLKPLEIDGLQGTWYNIAPLGKLLKEHSVEYEGKLKDVLSQIDNVELYTDTSKLIPVSYVQIIGEDNIKSIVANDKKHKTYTPHRDALYEWSYMGKYSETLSNLKEKALPESWSFQYEKGNKLSILDSYLRYTFLRIQKENKICYTKDGQWAIFNTGLVTKTYLPIYALFVKNKIDGMQPWHFNSFIAEGEKSRVGRISVVDFPTRPKRAQYFDDPADLLYMVSESGNELSPNYEHIITDNVDRLPVALLNEFLSCEISEKKSQSDFSSEYEYKQYLREYKKNLQEKIQEGNILRQLQERFRTAIDTTRNRVLWNYKTAIPTYYPKTGKITLLLPLSLVDENIVDLALVVSKGDGGYLAETIYTLDWAYKCARLICRPDSDWLTPSTITNSNTEETND